jgi:hypothetical protein
VRGFRTRRIRGQSGQHPTVTIHVLIMLLQRSAEKMTTLGVGDKI